MKILTLSNCPLERSQGSGYVILNFIDGLRTKGHQVDVFEPRNFLYFPRFTAAARHRMPWGILRAGMIATLFNRYDVVEMYGWENWLLTTVLKNCRSEKGPLLLHHSNGIEPIMIEAVRKNLRHTTLDGRPPKWFQVDYLGPCEWAFSKAHKLFTNSSYEAAEVVERGWKSSEDARSISLGLPEGLLNRNVPKERPLRIGFVGSWIVRKGTELIQTVIPGLLRQYANWDFCLVGVGNDFDVTSIFPHDIAHRIKVVPFVGEKEKLYQLYETFSVLVVPSIYESFGLVTAEGMACGCATVVTRSGFGADLRDGYDAATFNVGDVNGFRALLIHLINDETHRRLIASQGYERVQSLTWSSAIDKWEESVKEWLNRRARHSVQGASGATRTGPHSASGK